MPGKLLFISIVRNFQSMRRKIRYFIGVFYTLYAAGCSGSNEVTREPETRAGAAVWVTTGSQTRLLQEQQAIPVTPVNENIAGHRIRLDDAEVLQEIEGYGAALTGSSAFLLNKKLDAAGREALLKDLFDPEDGIGISYLRITMGASDFSLEDFTYNDLEPGKTDPELAHFSIEKDREDLIPVLRQILTIAPGLKIMATPWSPPAWMKTNGKLAGGRLKPEWYGAYAQYFVKYLRAYEQEGIRIDAISVQNEPLHEAAYPSMLMEANEQLDFIGNHLGPAFERENIGVKILAYDHNWDRPDYPLAVLNDATARKYVAGSAFHAYGGEVSAMSRVHEAFPDKGLYFTEISGGEWAKNFSDNMVWNMRNIFIGTARNWSKNALLWNLVLDENSGPVNNGCKDCRGVVTLHSSGSPARNVEYYVTGHLSKFVRPGARRLYTDGLPSSSGLEQVAFLNPDGSRVVVVLNSGSESGKIVIQWGKKQLSIVQEPLSTATYVIDGDL